MTALFDSSRTEPSAPPLLPAGGLGDGGGGLAPPAEQHVPQPPPQSGQLEQYPHLLGTQWLSARPRTGWETTLAPDLRITCVKKPSSSPL